MHLTLWSLFKFINCVLMIDNHWNSKENIRNFFDSFAASKGFDPLLCENWYSVTQQAVLKAKVCVFVSC